MPRVRPELRMPEGRTEIRGRFPDRIVHIGGVFAEGAVKLRQDEAWLLLHERRILLPGVEERLLVGFVHVNTFTSTTAVASIAS